MKVKVKLPSGTASKVVGIDKGTFILTEGDVLASTHEVYVKYPRFFESTDTKTPSAQTKVAMAEVKEVIDETVKKEEQKEELLIETPSAPVDVEIVVDETEDVQEDVQEDVIDYSEMTVKQLKALASERGIELTSTKKKDIIAELA